ncbi:MAG: response regulator [Burkholderiaceae bacterium]|nr:response regulator [Burkholderiaceae bacterium]
MDHILVVDDDRDIRDLLSEYLQKQGYRVSAAADGRAMRAAISVAMPDLIVLDVMLPGEDGLTLCRELRSQSDVPVLMLTARGEEIDRIVGLEMGADDYLAKPFNPRELVARIKSILRRTRALPPNLRPDEARLIHFSGWTLEVATRDLIGPDRSRLALSGTEFRLLRIFLDHPNRVLTRDQLIDLTQSREADPFDRSIDLQVSRVRRRLGDNPKEPTLIKTARGQGYVLASEVEVEH